MNWHRECRYKTLGRIADSPRGLVLLFDLEEGFMYSNESVEYTDPNTGKIKKRKIIYYPDAYKDRIGQSYSDYIASQKSSLYDQLSEMTGKTYDAVEGGESDE